MSIEYPSGALEQPTLRIRPGHPAQPDQPTASPGQWIHRNLFNTWYNSVLTVAFTLLIGWVALKVSRFVFVTGRWEIIRVNLTVVMLGAFPSKEFYRVWIAVYVLTTTLGLALGVGRRRTTGRGWRQMRAILPLLLIVSTLLALTRTITPLLLTLLALALASAGWLVGQRLPEVAIPRLWLVWVVAAVGSYAALTAFGGVGWDEWGGLLLTLALAIGGIALSFPLGVLLALGRRSSLPAVRIVCVGYIELIRGVPLITILFIGAFALGFILPPTLKPSLVTRALIALIAFTATYLAEVVRGGLQSVPKGQTEAAQAVGLSPLHTTLLVVLPQALRNVIPAIVGQFIILFKDTSLVAVIGLTELLGITQIINLQPQFLSQGLQAETFVFASFIYWAFCYSMSRASQRLEHRLGVGQR
jgi:general L-amino acid transport system permease protein